MSLVMKSFIRLFVLKLRMKVMTTYQFIKLISLVCNPLFYTISTFCKSLNIISKANLALFKFETYYFKFVLEFHSLQTV